MILIGMPIFEKLYLLLDNCIEKIEPGWSYCKTYHCVAVDNGTNTVMNVVTAIITIISILAFSMTMVIGYRRNCKY